MGRGSEWEGRERELVGTGAAASYVRRVVERSSVHVQKKVASCVRNQ